uniref:DUF4282 domain-containing protein n=1 Tax=Desulfobacca acetoxidans TaxID=60893 RepID=A0A7V4G906_9BACT
MSDFLSFRTMITPVIIQIVFWIGVVGCVLAGLGTMIVGSRYGGSGSVLYGLFILVLGPLLVRIYCELLIVFFRMNETLTEIKNALEQRQPSQG